ncbi:hypothetical protein AB0D45_10510 [Streptomyces sp. NPDC048352]|uniref:hypothetical protein n=1 Tax=Streptomyces sp. NPDC048352 TaxID=3154718 RepID=UPI003419F5B1
MYVLLDGLLSLEGELAKGSYTKVGNTRAVQATAGGDRAASSPSPWRAPRTRCSWSAPGAPAGSSRRSGARPSRSIRPPKTRPVDYGSQLPATKDSETKGVGQGSNPAKS